MVRLTNCWRNELTKKDFDQYPVWVWDDQEEGFLPLSDIEPSLNEHYPLFIKACFASGGYEFDGYLVGGDSFYAFFLFFKNQTFSFNIRLPEITRRTLRDLFSSMNCEPFVFFPIHYKSSVHLKEKQEISGVLSFPLR